MQLPLGVGLRDDATLKNYFPGQNLQVWQHVTQVAKGQGERFLYLWGPPGVGCTHLLQGACLLANGLGRAAFYMAGEDLLQNPDMLKGLEQIGLVCFDNIDVIAGNKAREEDLFHFFNRMRDEDKFLLVAGSHPPKELNLELQDLKSRLGWGVTYHLMSLSDDEKIAALKLRAKARGLMLSDDVGHFIVTRCDRSMPTLYAILDKLDNASLAAQRRLTIPFVKEVLGL
ncbi:MAG TPA: DnaA regulatory inactivator Hda [Gammaproteobacteria bacterium]|nr:DnaA regulatory inactivator Hda [Gammaproteobacteria bacterium]